MKMRPFDWIISALLLAYYFLPKVYARNLIKQSQEEYYDMRLNPKGKRDV